MTIQFVDVDIITTSVGLFDGFGFTDRGVEPVVGGVGGGHGLLLPVGGSFVEGQAVRLLHERASGTGQRVERRSAGVDHVVVGATREPGVLGHQ